MFKRDSEDTFLYSLPEWCSKTLHYFSSPSNFKVCYADQYNFLLDKLQKQMKSLKDKYEKEQFCNSKTCPSPSIKISFSLLQTDDDDEDDEDYEDEEEEEEEEEDWDEEEEEDYVEDDDEVCYSYDFDEGCSKIASKNLSINDDYLSQLLSPISPHLKNGNDFDDLF